ncbi:MAG: hypothetical protein WC708_06655 [Lentisphaeria bacterium]
MKLRVTVTTHAEPAARDRDYWRRQTPEARLDEVERLRLESGSFLYEYPARLQKVVTVTKKIA